MANSTAHNDDLHVVCQAHRGRIIAANLLDCKLRETVNELELPYILGICLLARLSTNSASCTINCATSGDKDGVIARRSNLPGRHIGQSERTRGHHRIFFDA